MSGLLLRKVLRLYAEAGITGVTGVKWPSRYDLTRLDAGPDGKQSLGKFPFFKVFAIPVLHLKQNNR